MSNFSDREDKDLVRLAKSYEDKGIHVAWADVAQKMKYSKKSARVLKQRLTTLKITHGKLVCKFPAWYFAPSRHHKTTPARTQPKNVRLLPTPRTSQAAIHTSVAIASQVTAFTLDFTTPQLSTVLTTIQHHQMSDPRTVLPSPKPTASQPVSPAQTMSHTEPQLPVFSLEAFNKQLSNDDHDSDGGSTEICCQLGGDDHGTDGSTAMTTTLSEEASYDAVSRIFSSVRRSDVRQMSGRTELNVGELSQLGVTSLIKHCQLTSTDVFVDVGSGIGNVVTQVALQSQVKHAIGVEIRGDVASLGQRLVEEARQLLFPQLERVRIIVHDICGMVQDMASIAHATVLFSSNLLFSPKSNLALHRVCCSVPSLRLLILYDPACHRHSPRCINEFCAMWHQHSEVIEVSTEFRRSKIRLFMYSRK